jgi:hypothetical protein
MQPQVDENTSELIHLDLAHQLANRNVTATTHREMFAFCRQKKILALDERGKGVACEVGAST